MAEKNAVEILKDINKTLIDIKNLEKNNANLLSSSSNLMKELLKEMKGWRSDDLTHHAEENVLLKETISKDQESPAPFSA